jgi:hypothetical protein
MTRENFTHITKDLCTDISNKYLISDSSGIFQNHLFGCLSILEYIDDGNAMLDGTRIHLCENSIELKESFDLSSEFHLIGSKFGFWDGGEELSTYLDDNYRAHWISLYSLFQDLSDACGLVEDFEEQCYNLLLEKLGKKSPFIIFIEGGTIESAVVATKTDVIESKKISKVHSNLNRTARRRRGVTPIFKRKGFNKTRKNLNVLT